VHDDFAVEPIPGLPELPPDGERILWQGAPSWRVLARRMFQFPFVAGFFLVMAVWAGTNAAVNDFPTGAVLFAAGFPVIVGGLMLATLAGVAFWIARTTVYTITSERVVIRFGLALPMTVNFPFTVIEEAGVKVFHNGTGNVTLALARKAGVAFLLLWPHVRPWRWTRTQPMLRGLPDARTPAQTLGQALAAHISRSPEAAEAGAAGQIRLSVGDGESGTQAAG